jgi:hypothetical protein
MLVAGKLSLLLLLLFIISSFFCPHRTFATSPIFGLQEVRDSRYSSVPVTHNIIPETSNHATTLTPIHVTTTHHNITAANLNNGMLGPLVGKPTMSKIASGANAGGSRLVTSSTPTPAALLEKQHRDQALRVFKRDGYTLFDPKKEKCEGKNQSYQGIIQGQGWSRSYLGCSGKVIPLPGTEFLHPSANSFEFGNLAPRP